MEQNYETHHFLQHLDMKHNSSQCLHLAQESRLYTQITGLQ